MHVLEDSSFPSKKGIHVLEDSSFPSKKGDPVLEDSSFPSKKGIPALDASFPSKKVLPVLRDEVLFFDDFTTFNLTRWQHEITLGGGGNWEFQYYTNNRSNSYVQNGALFIKPTLTEDTIGKKNLQKGYRMDLWGSTPANQCTGNFFYGCERTSGAGGNILNPIQSARIRTVNSFSFKYGRLEIRAKMPKGDWIWPAIWLLPKNNQYGDWPASGEIDIIEGKGNDPGWISSALHWGPYWKENQYEKTVNSVSGLSEDFHVFGLVWKEDKIYTYIDNERNKILEVPIGRGFWQKGGWGEKYANPWKGASSRAAPFDQEFYIVMNVAVGGASGFFPDGQGGKPWNDKDPHNVNAFYAAKNSWYPTWGARDESALQVDWIRVTSN